jgi:hypothetical protein
MERQHRDRQSVHKDGLSLQQTETLRKKDRKSAIYGLLNYFETGFSGEYRSRTDDLPDIRRDALIR